MDNKSLVTSLRHNKQIRLAIGFTSHTILFASVLTLFLFVVLAMVGVYRTAIFPILIFFFFVFSLLHLRLIGTNYDYENLEKRLFAFKTWLSTGRTFLPKSFVFRASKESSEDSFVATRSASKSKANDNVSKKGRSQRGGVGGQSVFGFTGAEVMAFELNLRESENDKLGVENFLSRLETLLADLPKHNIIRIYRVSMDQDSSTQARAGKKSKNNVSFMTIDLLSSSVHYSSFRERLKNLPQDMFRPLDLDEFQKLFCRVLRPSWQIKDDFDFESWYLSPLRLLQKKALIHAGDHVERALSISLAQLPRQVDDRFRSLFDKMSQETGTVMVSYEKLGTKVHWNNFKNRKIKEEKDLDVQEGAKDNRKDHATQIRFHLFSLTHAEPERLRMIESDLLSECARLPFEQRPVFARDAANMDSVLSCLTPGNTINVPFRKQILLDRREALLYAPVPVRSGDQRAPTKLRTECGSSFGWDVDTGHPTLILSKVEGGKSTLLGVTTINHITKDAQVASVVFEFGSSFEVLEDGLCDICFSLERVKGEDLDKKKMKPLPDHPLHVLMAFGEAGKSVAAQWLERLMKVGEDRSVLREIISSCLEVMDEKEEYDLDTFYTLFTDACKKSFKEVISTHSSKVAILNLKPYTSSGVYGEFFTPKVVLTRQRADKYKNIHHWYFRQKASSTIELEVSEAFFGFATGVVSLLKARYDVEGKDPRNTLIVYDEWGMISKFIPPEYWQVEQTQGRKQNLGIIYSTQHMSHFESNLPKEIAKSFLGGISRIIFYNGIGNMKKLAEAMDSEDRYEQIGEQFGYCSAKIDEYRNRDEWAWGFINEYNEFSVYFLDLSPLERWEIDTRPMARHIKSKLADKTGWSYRKCCRELSEHFKGKIHKSEIDLKLSSEILETVLNAAE